MHVHDNAIVIGLVHESGQRTEAPNGDHLKVGEGAIVESDSRLPIRFGKQVSFLVIAGDAADKFATMRCDAVGTLIFCHGLRFWGAGNEYGFQLLILSEAAFSVGHSEMGQVYPRQPKQRS